MITDVALYESGKVELRLHRGGPLMVTWAEDGTLTYAENYSAETALKAIMLDLRAYGMALRSAANGEDGC